MERKALYNSLRMNWIIDSSVPVEDWQVADYRTFTQNDLFNQLSLLRIQLDAEYFQTLSSDFDTPEELHESLVADVNYSNQVQDKIYLIVFELWRRLIPEKLSISIFCDELDHQIFLFDTEDNRAEAIQDTIANLQMLLHDYVDQGMKPYEVFDTICQGCANDLENFLYDYIAEQINAGNFSYAQELIDDFNDFVPNTKWLDFFQARILATTDTLGANLLIQQLVDDAALEDDIEFNFALLSFLVQHGDQPIFSQIVRATLPLIQVEEDFQELLRICADFYRLLDIEKYEQQISELIKQRQTKGLEQSIDQNDPDLRTLTSIVR